MRRNTQKNTDKPKILPHEYKRHYYSIKFRAPCSQISYVTLIYCVELTDKSSPPLFPISFRGLGYITQNLFSYSFFAPILPARMYLYHVTFGIHYVIPWQGARFLYFSSPLFGCHSIEQKMEKYLRNGQFIIRDV